MGTSRIAYIMGGTVPMQTLERFQLVQAPGILTLSEIEEWRRSPQTSMIRALERETDRPLGLLLFKAHKRHIEIISVAVGEGDRRKRIATNMFWRMMTDLELAPYNTVTASVPDNCDLGIALFRSLGFKAIRLLLEEKNGRDHYLFSWQRKKPNGKEIPHVRFAGGDDDHPACSGVD